MSTGPTIRGGLQRETPQRESSVRRSPGPALAEFDPLFGPEDPIHEARVQLEDVLTGRPVSLLVVEDDDDDLYLFDSALQGLAMPDLELRRASRGDDALEEIGRARPDLVVLDLGLPDRSGLDVLRELKARPRTRSIPVVVFSASSRWSDVASAYALGAASFVKKPDHPEEYSEVVGLLVQYWVRLAKLR